MVKRVLVADDHLLIRLGIKTLLGHLDGFEIVGEAHDGAHALSMIESLQPDLALIDISMPGISGIEVTHHARRALPDLRIVILSAMENAEVVREAMRAGANAYVLKDCLLDELGEALRRVVAGQRYISPSLGVSATVDESAERGAEAGLTTRQLQILRLVAGGATNKEIGKLLGISPKTVEFHRGQLMQRLGLRDVAGLTRYATERGLLPRN